MEYTLMHKNLSVAQIEIDEETGSISKIIEIYHEKHMPVGTVYTMHHETKAQRMALNHWWTGRSIPASRSGIREALDELGVYDTTLLLTHCMGLSLSDHYWIRPTNSDVKWEDVNFFTNDFSDDIGDVLFGAPKKQVGFDYSSPDNTSDGNLKKRWKIIHGKRCLLKDGIKPYRQQPFNELIATKIMERLGIYHVPYTIIWEDGKPYSMCEDFVTTETELVSAWRMTQLRPKANHENTYLHFVNICMESGVPDVTVALDRMLVLDYLIANEDRHMNNFGLLRNADTLEWIGFAPIFDSGTSLGYNTDAAQLGSYDAVCKPFKKTHGEQLRLVSDFSWIDFAKLDGIEDEIRELLSDERVPEWIDEKRKNAIIAGITNRIHQLQTIAMAHTSRQDFSSQEDDVEEDIAEDYGMKFE